MHLHRVHILVNQHLIFCFCVSPVLHHAVNVVQGMEYLEGRGIVHRDLAARNVLGKQLSLLFYTVSQKIDHFYFCDNFSKNGPIFAILSLLNS